jgi:uncharacterized protein (TIGR03066 family)
MRPFGAALLVGVLLVSGPAWGGDDKPAPKAAEQIVGEWQGVKGWETTPDMGVQFDKDGTFKVTRRKGPGFTKDNKKIEATTETIAEGRYKIEGNQLKLTAKVDGKEATQSREIKTLTDKVLILANEAGKTSEYKKK